VGLLVGAEDGFSVGATDGLAVGEEDGLAGDSVGDSDGNSDCGPIIPLHLTKINCWSRTKLHSTSVKISVRSFSFIHFFATLFKNLTRFVSSSLIMFHVWLWLLGGSAHLDKMTLSELPPKHSSVPLSFIT